MEEKKVDLVVIGSGPSGQKAAIQASKLGKKVIVVEKYAFPGGQCLNSGTIPSKTLREGILELTDFYARSYYGREHAVPPVSINDLNFRLNRVIEEERNIIYRQFKKNNIEILQGSARFENSKILQVLDDQYQLGYRISAARYIIATGSKPRNPIYVPFDKDVILDSTTLLSIDRVPSTMLVLGGGIIGSEYASFFSVLGTQVTIIDKKDHILPMLDHEIGIHLQTALARIGLKFLGGKEPVEIKRVENQAVVNFKDGTELRADVLLFALGRTANIDDLGIENTGVQVDQKGYIVVNPHFQTSVSNIYAVGDVIGGPCLASTSMEQGRLAARHACGEQVRQFPSYYPIGIYTIPEISSCGFTEEELKELGFHYEVGRAYYYEIARSHIAGDNVGMFKILFHRDTLEVLGVHVIGRGATEVIHIGQAAIRSHSRIDSFIDYVFNYPTYAEGYRVAALNGMNKIKHRVPYY